MGRLDLDFELDEVSDKRVLIPAGDYPGRLASGEIAKGVSNDDKPWMRLVLQIVLKDEKISQLTGQDEPMVFFKGFFSLDKKTGKFNKNNSPEVGQFVKAVRASSMEDYEDGIEESDEYLVQLEKLFTNIINAHIGADLVVKVGIGKNSQTGDTLNVVKKITALD